MIRRENYLENVDIDDKYNIKDEIVGRNMCCRLRHLDFINKWSKEVKEQEYEFRPLAAAVLGLNNTSASSSHSVPLAGEYHNTWTDIDEQQLYVDTKPNCYLILAKPGARAFSLGELLAKRLKCIHICPRNIILDEIHQKSRTGKCIDFNMKLYKELKVDSIMSMIQEKLKSPVVKHRGYVISGIPLITTSRSELAYFKKFASVEAVNDIEELLKEFVMNLKKKKGKRKPRPGSETDISEATAPLEGVEGDEEEEVEEEAVVEEAEEEEEDAPVNLPQFLLETCKDLVLPKINYYDSQKVVLVNQINQLVKIDLKPDIIIHITCSDEDLLIMKNHKYLDYSKEDIFVDPFVSTPISTEPRWPPKYSINEYDATYVTGEVTAFKYQVKPPMNFANNATEQLCNYRKYVLPFLEKKIKDMNPKFIINVDGRFPLDQMLYHISEKLHMLPLTKYVIIPEPLYLAEPPEDMGEFWTMVSQINVASYNELTFSRYPSPWYTRCPVELKKRKSVTGKPKYAVSFFKHVYLLSSLDALIDFWKNPRPYLHFDYLEPPCRIIIMGTKSSGKTMIAECLSWLFDSPILSYESIFNEEKQKKFDNVAQSVFPELRTNIEEARYENWLNLESQRLSRLTDWCDIAMSNLKKYVYVFTEIDKTDRANAPANLIKRFNVLREHLSFLPYLDDINQCRTALTSGSLMEYAPAILTIVNESPTVPVITDPDVINAITEYIEANGLQEEIEPTHEKIADVIISLIKNIDEKAELDSSTNGKYIIDGFTPEQEIWNFLKDAKMLPDYTICLLENRDIDEDLMKHYLTVQHTMKNHRERFFQAKDPFISIKLKNQSKESLDSNINSTTTDIKKITEDLVIETIYDMQTDEDENVMAEEMNAFTQAFQKFRDSWDGTKGMLEENDKPVIAVELENKNDVEVIEEVLLKLRQAYFQPCEQFENDEVGPEDEDETPKDLLTYKDKRVLGDTGTYCPVAYFDYGVLWEGKVDFSIKYGNKMHYFSKEECLETFRKDYTKYQFYNKPLKKMPPWRICVMGSIGSGKTTISKFLAKELGLIHIDFEEAVNNLLMPRHFKKVGRRYENSFTDINLDEEAVEAFQMMGEESESQISDILYNENDLRRMVYDYFEKGTPLLSVLMQKLLKKLWFETPYANIGFVIGGFPKCVQDVEDMVASFCIPDLILELESSSEAALERLSASMLKRWKTQQLEAKSKARKKFLEKKQLWMNTVTKYVVTLLVINDILTEVIQIADVPPPIGFSQSAGVVTGAEALPEPDPDANEPEGEPYIVTVYNEIVEQNPEPVDETVWERTDEAQDRIDGRIESIYEFDDENIQSIKDLLSEHKIKVVTVNATKSLNKVQRKALMKVSSLRNRPEHFEQTWVINYETAELLLSEGYYFLSKFSRMCPVYIYDNPTAILNPYKVSRLNGTLFPVVHRCYIYFIHGEESVIKFRSDPIKYIISDTILSFHECPLRLAVIGPPKSGKSTLAAKLAHHYGLVCVSKGKAIRNILENMHWTTLASKMNKTLENGDCIDYELIILAVQTALIDYRTSVHGFVLDGFPEIPPDAMELEKKGIYPLVIFDLSTSKQKIIENSQTEIYYDIIKYSPPYSKPYVEYRYSRWSDKSYAIRDFINGDCQNLNTLDGDESKWQCYTNAKDYIASIVPKVHYYIKNVRSNLILPVDVMCITNETFRKKMSSFENFCPVCLKNKALRYSGEPVDRKGVVQFQGFYYWVCSEHMKMVLRRPEKHLLGRILSLPNVPAVVKTINPILVYESGICIVTYAEHLPAQIIKPGSYKYAANYNKKIYLFCEERCLRKFLEKPHMYFDITVFKGTKSFPQICLKKLPHIGYLEQTVGKVLTRACCAVNVVRPKYPGLNVDVSGLLYVALYLKVNNPYLEKAAYPLYKKVFDVYEARSKYIIKLGLRLRSMDNPFASYPNCCKYKVHSKHTDSTVCKPSTHAFQEA